MLNGPSLFCARLRGATTRKRLKQRTSAHIGVANPRKRDKGLGKRTEY